MGQREEIERLIGEAYASLRLQEWTQFNRKISELALYPRGLTTDIIKEKMGRVSEPRAMSLAYIHEAVTAFPLGQSEEHKQKETTETPPVGFTTDEAQTATLIITEGDFRCHMVPRDKTYHYPSIRIRMCNKEALEPASRVFGTRVFPISEKEVVCPPELFPPHGKGRYQVGIAGRPAEEVMERLKPLIPEYYWLKWEAVKKECTEKRP